MAYEDITLLLGGWPGFEIAEVAREPGGTRTGAPQVTITLAAVAGALMLVALLAVTVPAVRAMRVDPMTAMRAN